MNRPNLAYVVVPSEFGRTLLVWRKASVGPRVVRIILPSGGKSTETILAEQFPPAVRRSHQRIAALRDQLHAFLMGEPIALSLDLLDFGVCSDFQKQVLLAEAQIPRGRVSTYGCLARKIGAPPAARAVGGALAQNPFPIVVPCHRTIRADGSPGGFAGELPLKRALLEMEGIVFDARGCVPRRFLW